MADAVGTPSRSGLPDEAPAALYGDLVLPEPPADRPYCYVNMVATVDGKIVLGEPGATARGLGGPTDQRLFRRLQRAADAAIIAAGRFAPATCSTRRISLATSSPGPAMSRSATASSPTLPNAPTSSHRRIPGRSAGGAGGADPLIRCGRGRVDLAAALGVLRREHGVRRLLCEGGASLNADLSRPGWSTSFSSR